MAVKDISKGGATAMPAGLGGELYVHHITVDFSEDNLALADVLKILSIPYGTMVLGIRAEVLTATTAGAGTTVDVGFYKSANDGAEDIDGLINELAIDALGEVAQAPAAMSCPTEAAYVALTPGAGAAAAIEDGVVTFRIATLSLA